MSDTDDSTFQGTVREAFRACLHQESSAVEVHLGSLPEPVRNEVRELLEELRHDPLTAERVLGTQETKSTPVVDATCLPESIDEFQIDRELGRGGFGQVYLVRRRNPDQLVALKLLASSNESVIARFRTEAQVLATLQHPNIVQLYEARAPSGREPYLLMEYVEGLPITHYCDRHELSIVERIQLFLPVCEAVQCAHDHETRILHRDLKPSNVLVENSSRTPKLLDFGIAKVLRPLNEFDSEQTATHAFLGTVDYSSPEQLAGKSLRTASDVYSLAVLLFELLTGHLPHEALLPDGTARKRTYTELLKAANDESHHRATTIVRRDGPALSAVELAKRRGSTPRSLSRVLAGDLSQILSHALRADPADRYGTPRELVSDLVAHLQDRPIAASRDGLVLRLRKFSRRHKAATAVLGAIALLLPAWLISLTLALSEAKAQENRAVRALRIAENTHGELIEIAEGLSTIPTGVPKVREIQLALLDSTLRRQEALLAEGVVPVAGARNEVSIRLNIVALSREIGDTSQAREQAESVRAACLAAKHRQNPEWPEGVRLAQLAAATTEVADLDREDGALEEARLGYKHALECLEQALDVTADEGSTAVQRITVMEHYANLIALADGNDAAELEWRRWIDASADFSTTWPEHPRAETIHALTLCKRAQLKREFGEPAAAAELFVEATEALEDLYEQTPEEPEVVMALIRSLRACGDLLIDTGEMEKSLALSVRAAQIGEDHLDRDPKNVEVLWAVARSYFWIGLSEQLQGNFDLASDAYERDVSIGRDLLSMNAGQTEWLRDQSNALAAFGTLEAARYRPANAASHLQEAAVMSERLSDGDSAGVDTMYTGLYWLLAAEQHAEAGQSKQALDAGGRAASIFDELNDLDGNPLQELLTGPVLLQKALVARLKGDSQEAWSAQLELVNRLRTVGTLVLDTEELPKSLTRLASLASSTGKHDEVEALLSESLALRRALVSQRGTFLDRRALAAALLEQCLHFAEQGDLKLHEALYLEADERAREFDTDEVLSPRRSTLQRLMSENGIPLNKSDLSSDGE